MAHYIFINLCVEEEQQQVGLAAHAELHASLAVHEEHHLRIVLTHGHRPTEPCDPLRRKDLRVKENFNQ